MDVWWNPGPQSPEGRDETLDSIAEAGGCEHGDLDVLPAIDAGALRRGGPHLAECAPVPGRHSAVQRALCEGCCGHVVGRPRTIEHMENAVSFPSVARSEAPDSPASSDLDRLEAESIHILRETAAECLAPVMLYSIGKDSSVLLHLLLKAFAPARPMIPLLHVDTLWKFGEMIEFRDRRAVETGVRLHVHVNLDGAREGIDPQVHGAARHTEVMKTLALKQALEAGRYDAAIGGARRDEEKSRAKERIFSFRDGRHRWDPRQQRPELWNLYNPRVSTGESVRVFPLSNWTELDVWRYIRREGIPVVPLYFAKPRPVVNRNGVYLMADDSRFQLLPGEAIEMRSVRFRTLGCYPLTGAVASEAVDLDSIISEMESGRQSERAGRLIDHAEGDSMEKKKREGYF